MRQATPKQGQHESSRMRWSLLRKEEKEELVNETVTKKSLSLRELRDTREDFSHIQVSMLFLCWDNRASSLKRELVRKPRARIPF